MTEAKRPWVWLSAGLIAAGAFLAYLTQVRDPDMFHHLAYGRDVVRHGLTAGDPFLFPMRGARIDPAPYWLGSVILYAWSATFGDGSMAYFSALVGALTFVVLLADSKPRTGGWTPASLVVALAVLAPAIAFGRFRAFARPEILATLFLAMTMWALRRFEEGERRLLLMLAPFSIVWTNVHPSVPIGVFPIGVFVASGLALWALRRWTGARPPNLPSPRAIGTAIGVGLLALAGSALSPSPFNPLLLALRFASATMGFGGPPHDAPDAAARILPFLKHSIAELQPLNGLDLLGVLGFLAALTALGFALAWRQVAVREFLTVLGFSILGWRVGRFAVMAVIVAAPITARNLSGWIASIPAEVFRGRARAILAAVLGAASALEVAMAPVPDVVRFGTKVMSSAYPVRAAAYARDHRIGGRVFDTFHFGGYLEWVLGGQVYQDGRGLVPPGEEAAALAGPANPTLFARLDATYRFDALIVGYPTADPTTAAVMGTAAPDADWGADRRKWALVAFDDGGLLYLRRAGSNAELIARDEFKLIRPANELLSIQPDEAQAVAGEATRAVSEAPECLRCRQLLGLAALADRRWELALSAVAPVLTSSDPLAHGAVMVAARAFEGRDDDAHAETLYRRLLEEGFDEPADRRGLAAIALRRHRFEEALGQLSPNLVHGGEAADATLAITVFEALHRPADAERWRRRGEALQREEAAMVMRNRALAAVGTGHDPAAIPLFEASLAAAEIGSVRAELGELYLRLHRYPDALREAERALTDRPAPPHAFFVAAEAERALGDDAHARLSYERFLDIDATGTRADRAREALQRLRGP